MFPKVRCADGVVRSTLGQWQGYLSDALPDPAETARRLAEVPSEWQPIVEEHARSTLLLYWVHKVLADESLDGRRDLIGQVPMDLRDDVRDQVAVLFGLRRAKTPKP